MMLEKEARVNTDFVESRASRYKEREIMKRTPVHPVRCCICGAVGMPSRMGHVGANVYKCAKCMGV